MLRAEHPIHVFLDARDLAPGGRSLRPTPAGRGEVHVVVDGLDRLDTGTLAGLLQIYAELLGRGAADVRFLVRPAVARELVRLGLSTLLVPATAAAPARLAA